MQSLVRSYRVILRADASTYLSFNLSLCHRFLLRSCKEQTLLFLTKSFCNFVISRASKLREKKDLTVPF